MRIKFISDLDLEDLDITSRDGLLLDIVNGHIRENLEDELVQEALKTVRCNSNPCCGTQ